MNAPLLAKALAAPAELGRELAHESALLHVTGQATYTDDIPELRGTLYAALVLSPVAHGELIGEGIDRVALLAQDEVVAVFTAGDIPGENNCGPIVHDDPFLAHGKVEFIGQAVAVVVARSMLGAEQEKWLKKYEEEQKKILLAPDNSAKEFLEQSKKEEEAVKKWIPTDAFHTASLGIVKDIENIITGTQKAGQVWQSFGQMAVQVIEEVIDKLVIMAAEEALVAAILSIFTGGIGAVPGVMQSGASGAGVFGGQVPMFDNNLDQIQSLHKTISTMAQTSKAHTSSVSVHPIITSQGLAVQVVIGQQQRSGRVIS